MLVDVIIMPVMQVAVVQVVDVVAVADRLVPTPLAVVVCMLLMRRVILHLVSLSNGGETHSSGG
ncbi:hypothetical protein WMF20_30205 [Sorangium sp. So ce834]